MSPIKGKRVLYDELSALRLRGTDKGRIQGEFEHHFFGAVEDTSQPLIAIDFGYGFWSRWYEDAKMIIKLEKLKSDQPSETLKQIFEVFFKTQLPEGVRITPELCHSWNDKHVNFLIEIWRQRSTNKGNAAGRKS